MTKPNKSGCQEKNTGSVKSADREWIKKKRRKEIRDIRRMKREKKAAILKGKSEMLIAELKANATQNARPNTRVAQRVPNPPTKIALEELHTKRGLLISIIVFVISIITFLIVFFK